MRYTLAIENEVKRLCEEGKDLDYISSATGIAKKVIWGWCPSLRPHEDVIRTSVKQRYHYNFPEYESKISAAFSGITREDITDDEWEEVNSVIHDTLFEEAVYVFKNVINDPPAFGGNKKLSEDLFFDYIKKYWSSNNELLKDKKAIYIKKMRSNVRYWSFLRGKMLKDVSNGDVNILRERLDNSGFAPLTISAILKAGTIPLKTAYKQGLTMLRAFDIEVSLDKAKPCINKDTAFDIFINANWKSQEGLLANWIAFNTGMTLSEIKAIKLSDIFPNFITSHHVLNKKREYIEKKSTELHKINTHLYMLIIDYAVNLGLSKSDFLFKTDGRNWGNELKEVCEIKGLKVNIDFNVWMRLKSS